MSTFVKKQRTEILRQALSSVAKNTPITAQGPGSIARSIIESVTTEIGDLYDVLDFNISQSLISTASGSSLDNIGELYGVKRRTLSTLAALDATTGSFYFYIDSPHTVDITIPSGTKVYSNIDGYIGRQISFITTKTVVLRAGRKKVYASLTPTQFSVGVTAGPNTITRHDATSPATIVLKCTNPKAIAPQKGVESDNDFRIRIMKDIKVSAGGTSEAIRFKLLAIQGIRDVIINSAVYGLGSSEIIIVPDTSLTNISPMVKSAKDALEEVRPVGVRMVVKAPTQRPIDISATAIVNASLTKVEKNDIMAGINAAIRIYLNSLLPNETLVYNRLIQSIMDVSEYIKDVQLTKYAPNGVDMPRMNYTPARLEQVIPGRIELAITP